MSGKTEIHPTLEEAVAAYAARAETPFDHTEAVAAIGPTLQRPPTDLDEAIDIALVDSPLLLLDEEKDLFVPRRTFFRGSQFLMRPSAEEVRGKMLIPGHRFMPFCAPEVFPPRCRMQWGEDQAVPLRKMDMPVRDLGIFVSLFDVHRRLEYLVTDAAENESLLSGPPDQETRVWINVFDLSSFFADQGFEEGDALQCTVEDWAEGVLTIERVRSASLHDATLLRRRWCQTLDRLLLAVFDVLGPGVNVDDQLAQAFVRGPDWLRESPPIHVGGYLAESDAVGIHQNVLRTILWRKNETPDELLSAAADFSDRRPTGRCDSLAAILHDAGLTITEDEVEALMRDVLWQGGGDPGSVLARILAGGYPEVFYDRRQERAFREHLAGKWAEVEASYDQTADAPRGPLRARALEAVDRQTDTLRRCDRWDLDVEDLPREESLELAHLSALFARVLAALNLAETSDEELAELGSMVETMLARSEEVTTRLLNIVSEKAAPGLKVLPRESDQPRCVYQLKITLKGIRPPIWRRVQVTDDTTLDTLDTIVQAAMGWHGGHLHCFDISGIQFSAPIENDSYDLGMDDETGVLLSRLADEEGDKFLYLYDFGDGWEHAVLLEKILPLEEGVNYPRCIKGRRACPPEDCGGVPGYRWIVDALADETHLGHDDEWPGLDFDPDAFDLDEVNARISSGRRAPGR